MWVEFLGKWEMWVEFLRILVEASSPVASVVHASGTGQLQENPPVVGLWLSQGKATWLSNPMALSNPKGDY